MAAVDGSWRVRGFFGYLRGIEAWGDISRVGFAPVAAVTSGDRERSECEVSEPAGQLLTRRSVPVTSYSPPSWAVTAS